MTGVDLLADPDISLNGNLPKVLPETFMNLVEMLVEVQSLYRETGGVHTSAEDIGRHNTQDKIAGLCLMHNVWPMTRRLNTTGRISSEMLKKAARLNPPFLISRTSPTSLSMQMAERYGITLIGYARKHRFNVYSIPQRVGR